MERKSVGGSVQVVADTVGLTAEEERVVRMRKGASVDPSAPLARAAGGNAELADELLLIEMQLLRSRLQAGKTAGLPKAVRAPVARPPAASPTKAKIVRALRRKR